MSISSYHLPKPVSWDTFEELTLAACKLRWASTDLTRHGRQGQKQDGVDIYGSDDLNRLVGVQCKNTVNTITKSIIDKEVENAEEFTPPLLSLFIATSADTDVELQRYVREISQQRQSAGKFTVGIIFWRDITHDLSKDVKEVERFYPQFYSTATQNNNAGLPITHQHTHQHVHQYQQPTLIAPPANANNQLSNSAATQRSRDIANLTDLLNGVDVESMSSYLDYAPKYINEKFMDQNEYARAHFRNPALRYFDQNLREELRKWVDAWSGILNLIRRAPYDLRNGNFIFNMPGDFVRPEHAEVYEALDDKTTEFMQLHADFCQWININYAEVDLRQTSITARRYWKS